MLKYKSLFFISCVLITPYCYSDSSGKIKYLSQVNEKISIDKFYSIGMKAYKDEDYVTALKYLFAYRAISVDKHKDDIQFLSSLNKAIDYCQKKINAKMILKEQRSTILGRMFNGNLWESEAMVPSKALQWYLPRMQHTGNRGIPVAASLKLRIALQNLKIKQLELEKEITSVELKNKTN